MRKRLPSLIGLILVAILLTLLISNLLSRAPADQDYQVQVPAQLDTPLALWQAAEAWIDAYGRELVVDLSPALDYNQRGLALAPDNSSLLLQQISLGLLNHDPQTALQGTEQLLALQPANYEARLYYCAIREKTGQNSADLRQCYTDALALFDAQPQSQILTPTRIFLMTLAEDPRLDATIAAYLAEAAPARQENEQLMRSLKRETILDSLLAPLYYRVYLD